MCPQKEQYKYDFFISYNHQDSDWVQGWLIPKLEEIKQRVFVDYRDFRPGASLTVELERAIEQSRNTLLILSPNYLRAEWIKLEKALVHTLDPADRQKRLIPIMLKDCELPLRMRSIRYLDFTIEKNAEDQFDRLIRIFGDRVRSTEIHKELESTAEDYNLSAIRDFLLRTFADEELNAFCQDYFSSVYDQFSVGMTKKDKTQLLLGYCTRYQAFDEFLERIKSINPAQYDRYESRIEKNRAE